MAKPHNVSVQLSFRASTPSDRERLHALWFASVEKTHHFVTARHLSIISEMVRDQYLPNASLQLAMIDGHAVGFIGTTDHEIDALFVHPKWMGQGIGRALIDHVSEETPLTYVEVNEQNPEATAFYQRLGFRVVGRLECDRQGNPYPILCMERGES